MIGATAAKRPRGQRLSSMTRSSESPTPVRAKKKHKRNKNKKKKKKKKNEREQKRNQTGIPRDDDESRASSPPQADLIEYELPPETHFTVSNPRHTRTLENPTKTVVWSSVGFATF